MDQSVVIAYKWKEMSLRREEFCRRPTKAYSFYGVKVHACIGLIASIASGNQHGELSWLRAGFD